MEVGGGVNLLKNGTLESLTHLVSVVHLLLHFGLELFAYFLLHSQAESKQMRGEEGLHNVLVT